ncbi:unnamed protein product [marine sediment metagenome]|uniref:Uncharacterized protein n=1 Tax=marine sediment metagenome TaxID=412755 RepID=X1U6R8_9ZZZZ
MGSDRHFYISIEIRQDAGKSRLAWVCPTLSGLVPEHPATQSRKDCREFIFY